MTYGLWVLWCIWALGSAGAALHCRKFLRHLRIPRQRWPEYQPDITVIVPIRGVDGDLPECVRSLCTQQCPNYRLIFVFESADDPAAPIVQEHLASHPDCPSETCIAGLAGPTVAQKVHNQLHVLRRLEPDASDDDVWVFADSDAVPGPAWLYELVRPLAKSARGASTGYRWLVPDEQSASPFWSRLTSVINSSIACLYWRTRAVRAWGGSMAMRVGTARRGDLIRRLEGALSDDFTVSSMCRDLRLRIYFVPSCLVATEASYGLGSLVSFGRRQYLATRVYAPGLYTLAVVVMTVWVAGFVSAWGSLVAALATGASGWAPGIAVLVVAASNQARAAYRVRVVRHAFGEEMVRRLGPTLWLDRWVTPVWMTVHWGLMVNAMWGRTVRWRGTRYRLFGAQRVERVEERGG